MDPDAALGNLRNAYRDGDAKEAAETARNLIDWLASGGFAPDWAAWSAGPPLPAEIPAQTVIADEQTLRCLADHALREDGEPTLEDIHGHEVRVVHPNSWGY